jgi:hypothetical protein
MNVLINLLGEQWLIGTIQLVLGALIKPQLKDKLLAAGIKATAFLPLINLIVAYIGFQVLPTSAHAAAFFPVKEGLNVAAAALLQTIVITGTFSFGKNTAIPVGKAVLGWAFGKAASWFKK